MLVSLNLNIASILALSVAVSAAPLNEQANLKRGIVGWLCHYDGPSSPDVDAALDLPSMIGGLCAQVNYNYAGCSSFIPNTKPANPVQAPQDEGTGVHSESFGDDEDQENDGHQHPTHKKKKNHPHSEDTSVQAASVPEDDVQTKSTPHKKNKNHPHSSGDDNGNTVTAHSFNDSDGNEPNSPSDHSYGSKHHKSTSEDPNTSVNSLSDGESDGDDTHGCKANEYFSSEADRCVDQSYFSKPQSDGLCKNGNFDAVIHLCLDVSTLGLTNTIHIEASALKSGFGDNDATKCPLGQKYSSLLSVCIDDKFFSEPLIGHQCEDGWKLDLVLGICLDLAGFQNQSNNS